jgi:16S rRNA (uracil1498-N3)-methyltransferase
MKIHRFIGQFEFNNKKVVINDEKIINHIKNVLKLKIGEKIILENGNLDEKLVEIRKINKDSIECEIISETENKNESETYGILYCAVLKKENFELVVQKATECGIKEIIPIISKRTIKLNLNYDRLQKIAKEAAEQSGRGIIPEIKGITSFEDAIERGKNIGNNFFCDSSGSKLTNLKLTNLQTIGVWIGPEGGWDETEINIAKENNKQNNFKIVSLGKTTLRAETAAIIASYLISNL